MAINVFKKLIIEKGLKGHITSYLRKTIVVTHGCIVYPEKVMSIPSVVEDQ